MAAKINSIQELKNRKQHLQKEVSELQDLITFENPKQSLSEITGGVSDNFLTEKIGKDGETKLALKTGSVVKGISNMVSKRNNSTSLIPLDNQGLSSSLLESTFRLGGAALIGGMAKKNLKSTSWKKKALGIALVYVLPIALKYARKRLEEFQKKQSISSIEKLI